MRKFSQIYTVDWSNGIVNIGDKNWNFEISSRKTWIVIGNQCQQVYNSKCGTTMKLEFEYLLIRK